MEHQGPSGRLVQTAIIVRTHYLPRSDKQHGAFFIVIEAPSIIHRTAVSIFQQHSINVVQFL